MTDRRVTDRRVGPDRPDGPEYPSTDYVPSSRVRWGIGLAVIPILVFAAIPLVAVVLVPAVDAAPWLRDAPLSTIFYLLVLAVVVVISRSRGIGTLADDFGLRFKPVDLALGAGIAVLYFVLRILVTVVLGATSSAVPTGNAQFGDTVGQNIDLVIGAVILAPLVEELVVRGAVMRAIRHAILRRGATEDGRPTEARARVAIDVSVVASALLFAVLHLYEAVDLVSAVYLGIDTFLFGLLAGWIATRTGRLGPGILGHAFSNGLALLLLATVPQLSA